jgi:voltage-gated potassium channel
VLLLHLIRLVRRIRNRPSVGFALVAALLFVAIVGNAAAFYTFEHRVKPELSWGDAFWYSAVSITTIGYGDITPSSAGARLGTVFFVMLVGLTSFSLFFGTVLDAVSTTASRAQKGLARAMAKDHILIVHFPNEQRVLKLIQEIRSDPEEGNCEIVIVSDEIDELPFRLPDVLFVRGSSHDVETYKRARAHECKMAVVVSPDYGNRNSDAIVAAAVSVIDRVKADIHIVAECLDEKHRPLFDSCNCDAVVMGMAIAGNLLIQEAHDPGIAQLIEALTSNRLGTTLFSVDVHEDGVVYLDLAGKLLVRSVTVMAINRESRTHTLFNDLQSKVGDRIVYSAARRLDWKALRAAAVRA